MAWSDGDGIRLSGFDTHFCCLLLLATGHFMVLAGYADYTCNTPLWLLPYLILSCKVLCNCRHNMQAAFRQPWWFSPWLNALSEACPLHVLLGLRFIEVVYT